MNTIRITLSVLTISKLYTLGMRIKALLDNLDLDALGIRMYVEHFLQAFEKFRISYEKTFVSAKQVAEKDAIRDDVFYALRRHLSAFLYHPDETMRQKAKTVLAILNSHGKNIPKADYKTQTAAFLQIFSEIDEKHAALIAELLAENWYNMLKSVQGNFEQTVATYTEQKADTATIKSASENREELEIAIKNLFAFLPLHYNMTQNEEVGKLIYQLQELSDRF